MLRVLNVAILVAMWVLLGCFTVIAGQAYAQEAPAGKQLQVKYAGNTAEPYTILVDSGRYSVSQSYSWVRDDASRYNLVSYSIDNGPHVEIPRKARGNFVLDVSMDSGHSVEFQALVQYPLSAVTDHKGDLEILFSPPSPTGDEWFDVGSEITINVSNKDNVVSSGIRHQVVSWSLDNSKRTVESEVGSSFTTPPIRVAEPHQAQFVSQTQYYVRVATDHGTGMGQEWYDEGNMATISVQDNELFMVHVFDGWEETPGLQLKEKTETFLVDSPKTLTAKWSLDYSRLVGIAIAPIGGVIAVILLKKRSSDTAEQASAKVHASSTAKSRQQVSASVPLLAFQQRAEVTPEAKSAANNDDSNYAREITGYALQKSIEKLQSLRTSGLVSDSKFSNVNEKLEQAFD